MLARETARVRDLGVALAVPPFAALRRVQDKLSAHATLGELSLPQPATSIARTAEGLVAVERLPAYVKTPIGTASTGVSYVTSRAALERLTRKLSAEDAFVDGGVLVQEHVDGPLVMVQAVFADGRLLAWHTNLRARLGAALRWHGALSLDAVLTSDGLRYIDVNPRIVEPATHGMPDWTSSTCCCGSASDIPAPRSPPGRRAFSPTSSSPPCSVPPSSAARVARCWRSSRPRLGTAAPIATATKSSRRSAATRPRPFRSPPRPARCSLRPACGAPSQVTPWPTMP